jgi:hypothetical protein
MDQIVQLPTGWETALLMLLMGWYRKDKAGIVGSTARINSEYFAEIVAVLKLIPS